MGKSRGFVLVVVGMLSFVLPAALCAALLILAKQSILQLAATTLAIGTWLALVALVNWWGFTSAHLRWGWVAAFTVAAVFHARGASGLPVIAPFSWPMAEMGRIASS